MVVTLLPLPCFTSPVLIIWSTMISFYLWLVVLSSLVYLVSELLGLIVTLLSFHVSNPILSLCFGTFAFLDLAFSFRLFFFFYPSSSCCPVSVNKSFWTTLTLPAVVSAFGPWLKLPCLHKNVTLRVSIFLFQAIFVFYFRTMIRSR